MIINKLCLHLFGTIILLNRYAYRIYTMRLLIDLSLAHPSHLSLIQYTLRMSHSHRKPIEDNFESYSFTEEFRPKKKDQTHRISNKIEHNSTSKQNQNPPKGIIKKFLIEEGAKICKRKQKSSGCKKKKRNDSENDGKMTVLQGEISEIKKAIQKMALIQVSQNPISVVAAKQQHTITSLRKDYQRLLEEKDLQLQVQLESKARLEQAHIQSQLFAQQTKQFSESIKKQLSEVAIKHIDCERREQEIIQLKEVIDQYRVRQQSLLMKIRNHEERQKSLQNNLTKQSCLLQEEICKLSQCLLGKDKEIQEWMEKSNLMQQNLHKKDQYYLYRQMEFLTQIQAAQARQLYLEDQMEKILNEKDTNIFDLQQKVAVLQSQIDSKKVISQEDSIFERKLSDFCSTSRVDSTSSCQSRLSLPESKVVIDGLSNMERKCEELYQQIRQERQKLNGLEEQDKNAHKKVQILEKEALVLKENNAYLQQILIIKEAAIQSLHQKSSKLQLKMNELKVIHQNETNILKNSLRECQHSIEANQQIYSSKLNLLQKELNQQKQRNEQTSLRETVFCKEKYFGLDRELNLLNSRLLMGQQIIQILNSQIEEYLTKITHIQQKNQEQSQKMREKQEKFALLMGDQVKYMRERIEDIYIDKKNLEVQLKRLMEDNQVLTLRLNTLNIELGQLIPQNLIADAINEMEKQHQNQKALYQNRIQQLKDQNNLQLLQKQKQYSSLAAELDEQKEKLDSIKLILKTTLHENQQKNTMLEAMQKLMKSIKIEIKTLQDQRIINQQRKSVVLNQMVDIQQRLQILSIANIKLSQQKDNLSKTVRIQEERITLLVGTIDALQQKEKACEEHIQQIQGQVNHLKSKEKTLMEQNKQQTKTIQANHLQTTSNLQHRIKDLQAQLHKYQNVYSEQQQLQSRARELESILKQSHSLLTQQRAQRQDLAISNKKLLITIEKCQLQLATRQKQLDTCKKEQQLLISKHAQSQQKQKQIRKRWETSQHQRSAAAKQLQTQAISIRVLREQNRNIEKVMSEQLTQRKAIIQQLVSQKKTLYSHLNH